MKSTRIRFWCDNNCYPIHKMYRTTSKNVMYHEMSYARKLILIFLLLHTHLFGQHSTYTGLVVIEPCTFRVIVPKDTLPTNKAIVIQTFKDVDITTCSSDTNRFVFYETPNASIPLKTLSFYTRWDSLSGVYLIEADSISWLDPLYSELDKNHFCNLTFICKSKNGKWLEVVTNHQTKETMWIQDTRLIQYTPWNRVPKKITAGHPCVRLTSEDVIYNGPNDNSKVVRNPKGYRSFEIIKVKKNWLKLSNDNAEYFHVNDNDHPITGWIEYKDTQKLLVDFEIK